MSLVSLVSAMGNRSAAGTVSTTDTVSGSYSANKLNQVTAASASWGGGANTSTSAFAYDQSGNLTQWNTTGTGSASASQREYSYDDADRLIGVVSKNPTSGANISKTEFIYDGMSRLRVSREYSWSGTAWVVVANSEKRRIYDGMDVVQERDASNAVLTTYTRDGNIGGILAKSTPNGATIDHFYFHYDGSGNVVGLSDVNQSSVASYDYDAYGNLISSTGAQASSNLYRYSTKEYFGSVGLYNYGYRFYSPGMGSWINRDPIEEEGGVNLYHFVGNDPVNSIDPYGLDVGWANNPFPNDPYGEGRPGGGPLNNSKKSSSPANSKKVPTFDARTERNLKTLHPKARALARKSLAAIRAAGIDARIISGNRTYAEQNALYAQGRTKPGKIVTNARGGYSNHNFGIAWDIGIFKDGKYLPESPLYAKAGKIGKGKGCAWGGDWEFQDQPHFEYPTGISMAEKRRRVREGLDVITGR